MKTYTFTLPKNNNTATLYKNSLMDRMINAYPWLTIDKNNCHKNNCHGVEFADAGDMITLGLSPKHDVSWLPTSHLDVNLNVFKCNKGIINFDLDKEFSLAMKALNAYAMEKIYPYAKDYDFEDEFGTPIKIFDNFVQIGYKIIPIEMGSLNYLKPETKKTVINIVIKIKNSGLY